MRMMDGAERDIFSFEGKQINSCSWSDLPSDLLNIIILRVDHFVDQIRLRTVCKNWQLAKATIPQKELPWLLDHCWDFVGNGPALSSCTFHVPSFNQTHVVKNIIGDEEQHDLTGAGICASKHGWLLLQKWEKHCFYNPFLKKVIKLPDKDIDFNRATFSTIPTSPDCLCFAIQSSKVSNKIYASICSPGDKKWHTHTFKGFNKAIEDLVYRNGNFYCLFIGGVLGVFRVADSTWEILTAMIPIRQIFFESRAQMIESNGELLLVCRSKVFYVFLFDWSRNDWKRNETLGNRALFLGCTSFCVSAEGDMSHLADRIYYHRNPDTCYYSLKTCRSYVCPRYYPWVVARTHERVWIEYT